jgi:nitrous oxide reductase accessory protein NosL
MLTKLFVSTLMAMLLSSTLSAKGMGMGKTMFQSVPMDKATILQDGKSKLYCPTCGMTLPMFYKTNHAASVDGHAKQFCSIHCLVMAKDMKNMDLKDIKVVDTTSLKFIDAKTAHYVIGSDKKGTMSMVSKYAFLNKSDAEAFAKENGGKVGSFEDALAVAKKDFSPEMMEKMKAKKAMMAKKGGMFFSKNCKQTTLPKFNSVAEAKSFVVENKLCGDIKGKPLQMVGLYLFTK